MQHNFQKMRGGGVKGCLESFRKFLRFGSLTCPLVQNILLDKIIIGHFPCKLSQSHTVDINQCCANIKLIIAYATIESGFFYQCLLFNAPDPDRVKTLTQIMDCSIPEICHFFLHEQNFWRIKFTPKKCVNYGKIHRKLPIFRVRYAEYAEYAENTD